MRLRTSVFLFVACAPGVLAAQGGRDLEFLWGRWYSGNRATTYEIRSGHWSAQALIHDSLGRRRAFYGFGWGIRVLQRAGGFAPYFTTGVSLGLSTDTAQQALAALWDVGGGVEWRPLSAFALGVEARYRLEDRGPRGFWRPVTGAPDGVSLAARVAIAVGRSGGGGGAGRPTGGSTPRLPPPEIPLMITGSNTDVVQTALNALGTPYQWGGTAENGFDCSGLIQYAYGQHGIRLPRMSRDQANAGNEVPPVVDALKPGDILLFSARPGGGVTHVGMYVGEQKFIHSSNSGVKLSRLEVHDPEGAWWLARWVGARRIRE